MTAMTDHTCDGCRFVDHEAEEYPCRRCSRQWALGIDCYEPRPEIIHKADDGKPPISLVPTGIIWEIAKVRHYGVNIKYPETGRDGWKTLSKERIRDAMLRHCLRYIGDPDGVDNESGLSHLAHMATNAAFLIELEKGDDP